MAFGDVIEQPRHFYTLPGPIETADAHVQAGSCISITKSRKRKRNEIVVGVDGECINVYSV